MTENAEYEYRLEVRFGREGDWRRTIHDTIWRGENARRRAIQAWATEMVQAWATEMVHARGTLWEYRIVSRTVTPWTPLDDMDVVLSVASGDLPDTGRTEES